MGSFIACQWKDSISSLYAKSLRLLFRRIDIPQESNPILFQKVQTFLKNKAIGGSETLIEEGHDKIKMGVMVTFSPFSIVHISNRDDRNRIHVYLNRGSRRDGDPDFFINYLNRMHNSDNSIRIYTLASVKEGWKKIKAIERINVPLLYTEETISTIDRNISDFLISKYNYQQLGKTYKLAMLFYGPNGSGKTTLVKHLAMKYGRDIYFIDPSHYFCDINDLQRTIINSSILSVCQGGILVFEDVDRFFVSLYAKQMKPNISSFLNFLDGLCTPENIIIIMTANYKGDIPDAIRRDGRIDSMINFPFVNEEILQKICNMLDVDHNLININGQITTSELIKKVEMSMKSIRKGESVTIVGEHPPTQESQESYEANNDVDVGNDSISILTGAHGVQGSPLGERKCK